MSLEMKHAGPDVDYTPYLSIIHIYLEKLLEYGNEWLTAENEKDQDTGKVFL